MIKWKISKNKEYLKSTNYDFIEREQYLDVFKFGRKLEDLAIDYYEILEDDNGIEEP